MRPRSRRLHHGAIGVKRVSGIRRIRRYPAWVGYAGRAGSGQLSALLLAIALVAVVDLILDAPRGFTVHVAVELLLIALSLGTAVHLAAGWRRTERSLARALEAHARSVDAWRERTAALRRGLGEAMAEQFDEWGLTPVERETALSILRGHSHKRIASLAGRSEKTVRQHASAVYRKSGLTGRAALAAYFLESLIESPDADSPP